jgi:hypothetical protein
VYRHEANLPSRHVLGTPTHTHTHREVLLSYHDGGWHHARVTRSQEPTVRAAQTYASSNKCARRQQQTAGEFYDAVCVCTQDHDSGQPPQALHSLPLSVSTGRTSGYTSLVVVGGHWCTTWLQLMHFPSPQLYITAHKLDGFDVPISVRYLFSKPGLETTMHTCQGFAVMTSVRTIAMYLVALSGNTCFSQIQ